MTYTPATVNDTPTVDYGEQMEAAISDYATFSKDYHDAEKNAVSAAKARLAKAATFEEQKYWYEKMEQHTSVLREHKTETAVVIVSLVLVGLFCICK